MSFRKSRSDRERPYRASDNRNGERSSRHYNNSPPHSSFSRGRRSDRNSEQLVAPNDKCFSTFYRERFGSHSPEDYRNLRISHFDRTLNKNEIRLLLEQQFNNMAPFEIKIVHNPEDDDLLAYVNFERDNCAKSIRGGMIPRLRRVLGRRLALDPTGVIRDQEGKYIPDRYNRSVMAADREYRVESSPPPRLKRRRSRSRDAAPRGASRSRTPPRHARSFNGAPPSSRENSFGNLVQDDSFASRTLFVGNLPGNVRDSELRRIFEVYGQVEEIEVKNVAGTTYYAFVLYRTVEDAREARRCQHNKPIRPGSSKAQIGYGKTQTSSRLYVGGLGAWTTAEMLAQEFDRYGAIDELEYDPGQPCAYIRFVDINSACDACTRMRNFELRPNHFITVDFAKGGTSRTARKRIRSPSADRDNNGNAIDSSTAKRAAQPSTLVSTQTATSGEATRAWSPTSAGYIATLDDLREHFACTWKGIVTLKKINYPFGFHRIYGKEHLLQDHLRDENGAALRLHITQRLRVDNTYYQEIIELPARELAIMIGVDGTPSAESVVHYLQEKNAAGLVTLANCSLNILPQSAVVERLLNFFAPRLLNLMRSSPTYMLVLLRKTISITPTQTASKAEAQTS